MRKVCLILLIGFLGLLIVRPAEAANKHYTLIDGEKDFYYGFISYLPEEPGTRLPEVIRAGLARPEVVSLNFPIGPGDIVETYDKPCEIQFDSGTIIRLGTDTTLKIETIMAQSLSSNQLLSNLFLEKGFVYLMYTAYNYWEVFQLLTPNAALKMKNKTVVLVRVDDNGETRLSVKNGKAGLLYGPSTKELKSVSIKKGTSLLVSANHQVAIKEGFPEFGDFDAWNTKLNKNFLELHEGLTPLPKPIQKLSPAVFRFAQFYSIRYGEWIWDDYFGYVWRPFYNDVYPWGGWSPYYYGRWTYLNSQLFWVPEEPWGWVPYHLGIWQWDENKGWVWIPGSAFAPAWAMWDFYFGYYTWRPWFLYDWLFYFGFSYDGYGSYYGYYSYGSVIPPGDQTDRRIITKITKDQLKKAQAQNPALPEDYKKIVANLAKAVKRGDQEAMQRIGVKPPEPVIIKAEDLGAPDVAKRRVPASLIAEKQRQSEISPDQNTADRGSFNPLNRVTFLFLKSRNQVGTGETVRTGSEALRVTTGEKQVIRPPESGPETEGRKGQPVTRDAKPVPKEPASAGLRFRDWNPDLKTARQLGVRIVYDSSRNSVVAPELGFTSREAKGMGLRITPRGLVQQAPSRSPGSRPSSYSSSSSSSSSSSGSASTRTGSVSRSSGGERSSGSKGSSMGREKH